MDSTFLEDLDNIIDSFDKTTKLRFRNSAEPQYIKFGGARDNDQSLNIRFGQLKLLGTDVANFFDSSHQSMHRQGCVEPMQGGSQTYICVAFSFLGDPLA